ncbi:multisubunit potassium/proton antiporter PhaA subunit /multisubunit potassium/proton antiporter PhaB subunit [Stella humosa]|uniref:Multisubunit potassium/proton antiporter PhaA subunit /multisubunit potassium/proton antiporter PhaB subunit n=1 Tax=Stella humosa TaxID=94 RepID=A0A3N1KZT5_9PROT|nr:monovalent cation/H+ antiporter subunit A [Stella humosa]ROP84170.1 multisubunit potassium/proton antiporter PhaA subunit /multisubunit potassium/proton antiporter PhaB subunit [Stella humosa]BBK33680.1 monovalent cation/H+ antiporter subunit A [Stella humosa]
MSVDVLFLTCIIILPFIGSFIAAFLPTNARNAEAWLAGGIALSILGIAAFLQPAVADHKAIRAELEWLPEFGLNFVLRLDGLAWSFVVLLSSIGALVVLYARYYMSPTDPVPRFFSFLLAFMGAMLGIVLSGNLIQIVFFWELTSLFSFLLIGYWHHNQRAREGARIALTVTAAGGLCLLAGMLVLGHIVGSYDLDVVLASGPRIVGHSYYPAALVLVAIGALTKSAQFPFHFWLPRAMAAPTPVSAYLHSATLVKAGVFLLARLWPAMAGHEYWFWVLAPVGVTTLLVGAFLAMFQQDLKGLLAYSTISHLGLITLLLGLGSPLAAVAAIFHIMNHATFKASLFMAAGIIDHEAGTRDVRRLGGLYRAMPITAALAMVAAASMAGVPLLNGFLSKEMFFTETIEDHVDTALDHALPYIATVAGMFSVAYSLRLIHQVFFGPRATDLPRQPHDPVRWMLLPVAALVLTCLLVGIVPTHTVGGFLAMAVEPVLGAQTPEYSLAVWHGFTPALFMSFVALGGGIVLYLSMLRYLSGNIDGAPGLRNLTGKRIFERAIVVLSWRWARDLEHAISTVRLQPQMRLLIVVAIAAALWSLAVRPVPLDLAWPQGIDAGFALVWVIGGACALGTAYLAKYHRLAAIILAGGTGLATCLTFAWFSAPDLALTQLLVEIVTTVLLLLGLRWLPIRIEGILPGLTVYARLRRARDLVIAVAGGAGLAALSYMVMIWPLTGSISGNFLERAYTEGGGRNVVNVILVDFRGFDTLGEITVLGVVAITVYALLRRFRPARDSIDLPAQKRFQNRFDVDRYENGGGEPISAHYMLVPGLIMRLLFPVIAMMAMFLFLRGHDLPGGGFVAGLTFAIAYILQYMAGGVRWVEDRLRVLPVRWIGIGLLAAAATGAGAWGFGRPFLTTAFAYADIPWLGQVPLASALLFDFGVFSLVLGATVLILIALAHQSLRVHRAAAAQAGDGGAGEGRD